MARYKLYVGEGMMNCELQVKGKTFTESWEWTGFGMATSEHPTIAASVKKAFPDFPMVFMEVLENIEMYDLIEVENKLTHWEQTGEEQELDWERSTRIRPLSSRQTPLECGDGNCCPSCKIDSPFLNSQELFLSGLKVIHCWHCGQAILLYSYLNKEEML